MNVSETLWDGWITALPDIILSVVQKDCEFYDGRDFVSIV